MGLKLPHLNGSTYFAIAAVLLLTAPPTLGYMAWEGQNTSVTTLSFAGAPEGIVFIADPHLREDNIDHIRRVIEEVNALNPSVVLIGGDFVYGEEPDLSLQEIWREIDAPTYAVLGNHDYKAGIDAVTGLEKVIAIQETERSVEHYDMSPLGETDTDPVFADALTAQLESAGVHVLRNEYVTLDLNGTPLLLVGVDDGWAGMADPPTVPRTDAFTIYLIHEPECRAPWEADLILCGHTHGGQFMLPGIQTLNDNGVLELSGLVTKDDTPVYISRGLGTSNLPAELRLNAPPEIVLIGPAG
ncbi:metallophosphoesterase [Methanofollis fontis]|uniref:Metallophosphoesterase n=1 Tax=Methanofollis fontis TaxID=2052832 RepID=A0A483CPX6_9EURY|nr:metallophosphoesterase [Methanofollis fontis]TAJ45195.1 metallophosphoesterase [Methanofollis fontis]